MRTRLYSMTQPQTGHVKVHRAPARGGPSWSRRPVLVFIVLVACWPPRRSDIKTAREGRDGAARETTPVSYHFVHPSHLLALDPPAPYLLPEWPACERLVLEADGLRGRPFGSHLTAFPVRAYDAARSRGWRGEEAASRPRDAGLPSGAVCICGAAINASRWHWWPRRRRSQGRWRQRRRQGQWRQR